MSLTKSSADVYAMGETEEPTPEELEEAARWLTSPRHPSECECCTFEMCRTATCQHREHQRRPWVEHEGESAEHRALRRAVWETGLTPVEWAMLGVV